MGIGTLNQQVILLSNIERRKLQAIDIVSFGAAKQNI